MGTEADTDFYRKDLRRYETADPEEKVRFILNHFAGFELILTSYEDYIRISIEEECRYNRRKEEGDAGVRVHGGVPSDPTLSQAVRNMEIDKAIRSGDMNHVLAYTDDPQMHQQDCFILSDMRSDYRYTVEAIRRLRPEEQTLYLDYITGRRDLYRIAEECGIQYQSAKNKIARIRIRVVKMAGRTLLVKYGGNRREWLWNTKLKEMQK